MEQCNNFDCVAMVMAAIQKLFFLTFYSDKRFQRFTMESFLKTFPFGPSAL